jgi:hypothetical protein
MNNAEYSNKFTDYASTSDEELAVMLDNVSAKQKALKPVPPMPDGRHITDHFIYIDTENAYFRIKDRQIIKPDALNRSLRHIYKGVNGSPSACSVIDTSKLKRVVSGIGWLPVDDAVINLDGIDYVNTYRGIQIKPVEGSIFQGGLFKWLRLCCHIYGKYTRYVLDHWAYSIQFPLKKIRWQILCCGSPRTGKSLTARPIVTIWGEAGSTMDITEMKTGWGDGYVGAKFVLQEEIYAEGNRAFYNDLKSRLANDYTERLNRKGGRLVVQQNLMSMALFTNHMNALNFDVNDDKLLVIEAPDERLSDDFYTELGCLIDEGDLVGRIYSFLLKRDVSKFSYSRLPVRTEAAEKMSEAGRPDYQRAVIEMIDSEMAPFKNKYFLMDELKHELSERRYKHFGDNGLSEVLNHRGYHKYRGQIKVGGKILKTPYFWSREDLRELGDRDLYDWFNKST